MSGNDVVFKIKNEMPVPVMFDKVEVPNGEIANGNHTIPRTIGPGQIATIVLEKGWLSTIREATLFYYFDADGTRVDFHLYGYLNDGIFGLSKNSRYDLRAPGQRANTAIDVNRAHYSVGFTPEYVLMKGQHSAYSDRLVEFYEYHVNAVLRKS